MVSIVTIIVGCGESVPQGKTVSTQQPRNTAPAQQLQAVNPPAGASADGMQSKSWVSHKSVEGRFEALFPVEPESSEQEISGPLGKLIRPSLTAHYGTKTSFIVQWLDYPESQVQGRSEAGFFNMLMATELAEHIRNNGGDGLMVLAKERVEGVGHPCMKAETVLTVERRKYFCYTKYILVGRRFYTIAVVCEGAIVPAQIDAFLNGFKLIESRTSQLIDPKNEDGEAAISLVLFEQGVRAFKSKDYAEAEKLIGEAIARGEPAGVRSDWLATWYVTQAEVITRNGTYPDRAVEGLELVKRGESLGFDATSAERLRMRIRQSVHNSNRR
jgi:hypothetical protein